MNSCRDCSDVLSRADFLLDMHLHRGRRSICKVKTEFSSVYHATMRVHGEPIANLPIKTQGCLRLRLSANNEILH